MNNKHTINKVGKYTVEIRANGDKLWFYKGQMHREDGPAYEGHTLYECKWWLEGFPCFAKQTWQLRLRRLKLKALGL